MEEDYQEIYLLPDLIADIQSGREIPDRYRTVVADLLANSGTLDQFLYADMYHRVHGLPLSKDETNPKTAFNYAALVLNRTPHAIESSYRKHKPRLESENFQTDTDAAHPDNQPQSIGKHYE